MGKSYLVTGARLRCMCGSKNGYLIVTVGWGYTADGKMKANCRDCKAYVNITPFGECAKNEEYGLCDGYMELSSLWQNTSGTSWKLEKIDGNTAITMDSILLCRKGGLIVPETSGQGMVREINWNLYIGRYKSQLQQFMLTGDDGCVLVFDPININTGNFLYDKEDLIIHGVNTISFHIYYMSMEEYQGGSIGEGWHHNYEIFIDVEGEDSVWIHLGTGQVLLYRKKIGNIFVPVYGNTGTLNKDADGYRYKTLDGLEYIFDQKGKLLYKVDRSGNTDTFIYNEDGHLSEVRGANGGILYYYYNKEGNLYRVCDHAGREVQLHYSYRVLCEYVNSTGQVYTYKYNENLRLESVTSPRGIMVVKNVYDSANRVLKQITPDNGVVELLYDDAGQCTYAKNQNGYIVSYESDDRFRNIRTDYKDGAECFEYNDNNQKTLYIDKNGNKTQYRYDDRGRLINVVDALGRQKTYTYNEKGKLLTVGIGEDRLLENIYDKSGYLIETTDALGRSVKRVYDEKGYPKQIIQPDGSSIKFTHDKRGNITSITDTYDNTTRYDYDDLNRVVQITDNEGGRMSFQYDERDHLLALTNPEGAVRSYTYNVSGKPVKVVDFDGSVVSIDYNVMGMPEKITDKEGYETRLRYDLAGNLSEEVYPTGAVSIYEYDRNDRLIHVKLLASQQDEEASRVVDYIYDPVGNLLKAQAGDGKGIMSVTAYEYDALNRVSAIIDPAGGRTTYIYDKICGKVSGITDAAGNQRAFRYNKAGELIERTDIRGNITRYEYNALGKLTVITDEASRTTRYYYLPGGRLEKTVYPDNRYMVYEYDNLGRLEKKTDQNGYSMIYTYDCMGRVTSITSSTGQEKIYVYDRMGNVVSVTDANGNKTKYSYTKNGKLKEVVDAMGNKTEYAYDPADRLIYICQHGQTGEADRITEYERDVFGQIQCIRDALGGEEQFLYDALGRITKKTDREGLITEYTYTEDGKIQSILYNDGRMAELEYTPLRQLAVVKDWLGEIRIERDSKGDPLSITDHKGRTVRYEWGSMGQRQGMIYPDGTRISWKRDSLLRPIHLTQIAEGKEPLWIEYKYDKQGHLSEKKSSGGYITKWEYNENGLLDELSHKDASGILERFCYTYDLMGNRTVIVKERRGLPEESGSYRYSYDALQRLTDVEKDGNILRSYQYDSFGNRTEMVDHVNGVRCMSIYDSLNRLQEQESWEEGDGSGNTIHKSYTYDRRGNLTGEYQEGELLHGYTFDSMNRLQKAWNNQGKETEYIYNALGQRTEKYSGEETEDYLLDLTKSYNNLLGLKKGRIESKFYYDSGVTAMEEAGKMVQYVLSDELGSPLRIVYRNGHGDTYGYDEFGKDLFVSGSNQDVKNKYTRQGQRQPFGYTGYRYDDTGETYFAQAREYRPDIGRFTAEDVIKGSNIVPITLNRYNYCWGNPIILTDLDGKLPGEWEYGESTDYEGVYYLNAEDGAYTFGHAAMMFVREDGSGTFYSFAASPSEAGNIVMGNDVPGYLSKAELSVDDVAAFLGEKSQTKIVKGAGKIYTDGINGRFLDGAETPYTRAIYIPITTQEGKVMSYYAEYLRDNPGQYNLYARNCGMVVQEILQKGGKNFAALPGSGKQLDEQMALARVLAGVITGHWGMAGDILLLRIAKDYLDQTIPDAAYYSGWIQTHTFLWMFGWETRNIDQYKD